jgi:hypothetical protein
MYSLLTSNNTKTNKSVQYGYLTNILHLSPSTLAGVGNMCPKASAGCIAGCLNTAGHGGMFVDITKSKIQNARKRRTELFVNHREDFMVELYCDIRKAIRYAESNGLVPVFRLSGTSDTIWERIPLLGYKNIFEAFPTVQFYDYTKIYRRLHICKDIANYHLTFSKSEINDREVQQCIDAGFNVAVVFKKVPSMYKGVEVIDGDIHDLRFLDARGVIVGLKAKGRARKDSSGFVVREV